jgi:hypothetical protein
VLLINLERHAATKTRISLVIALVH